MRPSIHVDASRAFDLALGASFAIVALAAFLAGGRPGVVLRAAHGLVARAGWQTGYDLGLLGGLAGAVLVLAACVVAVRLARGGRLARHR